MSQELFPIDGGRAKVSTNVFPTTGVFLSEQFIRANNLEPTPTEWRIDGRPIYNRLPSASERYKLYFGLGQSQAYTYIPPGIGTTGPGSMQVVTSGGNKFLAIQGGQIVWEYGNLSTNPVLIDLELMDMRSTRYFLGYQMYYDDAPFVAQYSVEDFSLAGYPMNIQSSTDTQTGWRYTPMFAFTTPTNEFWSNHDDLFPSYTGSAYLFWQSEYPNTLSKIKLRCPEGSSFTGTATLYYQLCPNPVEGEKYCSAPSWSEQYTVGVQSDETGQYYEFSIPSPTPQYGWRVEWSDPIVAINSVLLSGVLSLNRKPASATTNYQLVAYPENVVPEKIVNSQGEEVPLVMCNLAYVDINEVYEVEKIQDIRELVYKDHQPIADWLTKPWDNTLIKLYQEVDDFENTWMNPNTCLYQEYAELSDDLIQVEIK